MWQARPSRSGMSCATQSDAGTWGSYAGWLQLQSGKPLTCSTCGTRLNGGTESIPGQGNIEGAEDTGSCFPIMSVRKKGPLLMVNGFTNGLASFVLVDSGSTGNFISRWFAKENGLPLKDCYCSRDSKVEIANGQFQEVKCMPNKMRLVLGKFSDNIQF